MQAGVEAPAGVDAQIDAVVGRLDRDAAGAGGTGSRPSAARADAGGAETGEGDETFPDPHREVEGMSGVGGRRRRDRAGMTDVTFNRAGPWEHAVDAALAVQQPGADGRVGEDLVDPVGAVSACGGDGVERGVQACRRAGARPAGAHLADQVPQQQQALAQLGAGQCLDGAGAPVAGGDRVEVAPGNPVPYPRRRFDGRSVRCTPVHLAESRPLTVFGTDSGPEIVYPAIASAGRRMRRSACSSDAANRLGSSDPSSAKSTAPKSTRPPTRYSGPSVISTVLRLHPVGTM
jgi:hypothetical protein